MKFSVIIPLYNKAPYVAKAIQSVLAQTFADYELVIVDDGSKDKSAEIAAKAIENHVNCRLIWQDNAGVSMARNNGVGASFGDYLCFLDADDWWEPVFLEEMERLIGEFPDAGIYGTNYTIVNETRRKPRVAPVGVDDGFEKGYIDYCRVYAKTMAMPLWTGAVCIPRPVFDEMQGFPKGIKLGEDFLLWIHIALKYRVVFLNRSLAYYNQNVEIANRARNHLYPPEHHMLWHLDDLEPIEHADEGYKILVDNLRVQAMCFYLLDNRYKAAAYVELAKVDWQYQDRITFLLYHSPLWVLRFRDVVKKMLSKMKRKFYK